MELSVFLVGLYLFKEGREVGGGGGGEVRKRRREGKGKRGGGRVGGRKTEDKRKRFSRHYKNSDTTYSPTGS